MAGPPCTGRSAVLTACGANSCALARRPGGVRKRGGSCKAFRRVESGDPRALIDVFVLLCLRGGFGEIRVFRRQGSIQLLAPRRSRCEDWKGLCSHLRGRTQTHQEAQQVDACCAPHVPTVITGVTVGTPRISQLAERCRSARSEFRFAGGPRREAYKRPTPLGQGRSCSESRDELRSVKVETWLILPVVICLSQRLSHACLSMSLYTAKLRMAH